jgi:cell division protein FtsQ
MAALGVRAGQPIFNVDVREARLRLLQLPWVAETDVMRRYPDDISVHIVERSPYARWQTDKGLVLVERQGRVILPENNGKFAKLPLLMGEGAPLQAAGFVEAVSRYRGIVKRVSAYQYQSARRWNLLLDDGVVVKLPEIGWQKELPVLEHLIVDKGILESDIREVDLRNPLYFYFQLRNGVEHKEKRSDTGSAI